MKNNVKKLIRVFFRVVNIIYSYNTKKKIQNFYSTYIFSYWLRPIFKSCGDAYFNTPIYIKGAKYISIGDNFGAGPRFRIEAFDFFAGEKYSPIIEIGDNVSFNFNCHVGAINKIIIHNNVLIGSNVLITDHSHGDSNLASFNLAPSKRKLISKGTVIIEENVWIGENVSILPNVTIGRNSVIGANSVVTKNVLPFSIVGGNPAKIIKQVLL